MPIILLSCYSEHEVNERFAGAGLAGLLQKPFMLNSMQRKLQQALSADSQRRMLQL